MEEYKLIDLGLPSGTLWMDRNIGALSPIDSGLYFAWGETKGYTADEVGIKKQFAWFEYKYANGDFNRLTKYCNMPNYCNYGNNGYTDGVVTLQTTDDAVYQFTDGECSMPTREQIYELIDNTVYKWTIIHGIKGGLLTSKINGNSIFLPADGYCANGSVADVSYSANLCGSNLIEDTPTQSYGLGCDRYEVFCAINSRFTECAIRGVKIK